jgi:RNA polymerase sigma-70 factor (ECF subfamily)
MELDRTSEDSPPATLKSTALSSALAPMFDPVRLGLGAAGDDGERLVFCQYKARVQRFFRKKGAPPEEAKDLTQETFLRVFRSEARLENRAQLEGWLFEIAKNVWANHLRANATLKRSATLVSLDEPQPGGEAREIADPALQPGEKDTLARVVKREELELLQSALSALPPQMRQCVRLRIQDGLKYKEIAEVLKISIDTVKSHLHLAKQRLRSTLEAHFGPLDF